VRDDGAVLDVNNPCSSHEDAEGGVGGMEAGSSADLEGDAMTNLKNQFKLNVLFWVAVALVSMVVRSSLFLMLSLGMMHLWIVASWHAKAVNRGGYRWWHLSRNGCDA
jgi:hypothetical protein